MASSEQLVAIVSLIVAVIAFWIAAAQALQQYVSTAEGYRKCAEAVVGPWARYRKRTFEPSELRFVVTYATPVFFVPSPISAGGPLPKAVDTLDGTVESRLKTLTTGCLATLLGKQPSRFHRVISTNDALASWVMLLFILQDSEENTRRWDDQMRLETPAGIAITKPEYTMCVRMQKVDRNWDFMPDSVTRPYATTALPHLVEVAVMLGMSWRVFEPETGDLSAEGDNMTCNGWKVPGSGICVTFTLTGAKAFNPADRIIPNMLVKKLIYGSVPSILDSKSRSGADILLLNFGDERVVRETLEVLHFSRGESDRYLAYESRSRAINFELISMLGQVFRLRGSNFKRLPNPNTGPWVGTFDACKLVEEFQTQLDPLASDETKQSLSRIRHMWNDLLLPVWKRREEDMDIVMREAVHNVIDECDSFIHSCATEFVLSVVRSHLLFLLDRLERHDATLDTWRRSTRAETLDYFKLNLPGEMKWEEFLGIWLMLRFRGCLWWTLHEFDQSDTKALDPKWRMSSMTVMIL